MSEVSEVLEVSDKEILEKLCAPFPSAVIQRTKAADTKKGYDTTGYPYQCIVNRFNEVLGTRWGFEWRISKEIPGMFKGEIPNWEIAVEVSIWVLDRTNVRTGVGSHLARSYGDAVKGAITNAFKKTGAFWGVGRQAYEGVLDDDSVDRPEGEGDRIGVTTTEQHKTEQHKEAKLISPAQKKLLIAFMESNYMTAEERIEIKKNIDTYASWQASRKIEWWIKERKERAKSSEGEVLNGSEKQMQSGEDTGEATEEDLEH